MLVQGHYLRKKYKDPITDEEFDYIRRRPARPGQTGQPGGRRRAAAAVPATSMAEAVGAPVRSSRQPPAGRFRHRRSSTGGAVSGGTVPGGMMGVRSKSKDESIRLYLGRNHYNEWMFTYVGQQQAWRPRPRSAGRPGGPGGRPAVAPAAEALTGPGGRSRPDAAAPHPRGSPAGPVVAVGGRRSGVIADLDAAAVSRSLTVCGCGSSVHSLAVAVEARTARDPCT